MHHFATTRQDVARTTVILPVDLVRRSQRSVGNGTAPSRNALLVAPLERLTRELEQQAIDQQFTTMGKDIGYRQVQMAMVQQFDASD